MYMSRMYMSRSRLRLKTGFSLVESLHWTWAFPRGLPQMLQLGPKLVLEKNVVTKWKKPKLLEIA